MTGRKISLLICLVLSLVVMFALPSCGGDEPPAGDNTQNSTQAEASSNIDTGADSENSGQKPDEPKAYTVTFIQDGFADVVKTVKPGEALNDIPTPQSVDGYDIVWENVDLSIITGNITVRAVATQKVYKVTFIQDGFDDIIKVVKHGETLTDIPIPQAVEGYDVVWEENNFSNITSDLYVFVSTTRKEYKVTFIQDGFDDVVKVVKHGETLTDIPKPQRVDGYDIEWEETDLSNITSDVYVYATNTQKVYKITFVQAGFADVVKTVKHGATLTDIPTPRSVTGYDVVWEDVNLSNITSNITVYAIATQKEYKVTFIQEGFANVVKTVKHGATLTDIPTPKSVEGYNVVWEDVNLSNITSNITVYAIATLKKYTVTFVQDGFADVVKTVKHGATLTDIPTPRNVTGYDVVWEEVDLSNITSNITVYAIATQKEYKVTFIQDGFADVVKTVKHGETLTDIPNPQTVAGYNIEWVKANLSNITGNVEVYSQKTPVVYKIKYVLNGGVNNKNNPESYTIEDFEKDIYIPTKWNGATFGGWYTTKTFQPETKVTSIDKCYYEDITLYAYWIEYQVEEAEGFELDTTGTVPKLYKVIPNSIENIDLNQAVKVSSGCTWRLYRDFQGYDELRLKAMTLSIGENKAYIIVYHPDGEHWSRYELVLYRLDTYEYAFNDGTSVVKGGTIEEQSTITAPETNPQKTGYNFAGWAVNGNIVSFPFTAEKEHLTMGSIVFVAQYTPIVYEVTYVLNGGINNGANPETFTIEESKALYNPTREHYNFAGWYLSSSFEGRIEEITFGTVDNKTLYAKWTPKEYAITYELNGGVNNGLNPTKYTTEQSVTLADPTRAGYTFAGWFTDEAFKTETSGISTGSGYDKTFYAKWTANENTIVFDANSGIGTMGNMTIATDSKANLTANAFTKAGYTFIGWSTTKGGKVAYTDGAEYTMGTNSSYTLYAVWQANINTLVFNANGGVGTMENMTIATDSKANFATNAFTKPGYTFIGWSTTPDGEVEFVDGAEYTMGTNSSYTLYAVWQANVNTVVFNANSGEGTMENMTIATDSKSNLTANVFTKAGYTFVGWSTTPDGEVEFADGAEYTMGTDSLYTLYAVWQANVNGVTFNANGGEGSMPSLELATGATTTLTSNSFTKYGYTFKGWSTTSDGEVEYADGAEYTMGTNSSYTLYAIWNVNVYTITYYQNGITGTNENLTQFTVEDLPLELKDLVVSEVLFDGWYKESDFSGEIVTEITELCNIDLYAKYIGAPGLELVENTGKWTVSSYTGNATRIEIPNYYKGKPVIAIASSAFENCTSLTSVVIGDSVTSIGSSAFYNCKSLTSVAIPDSVTSIGSVAFHNCTSLTSVNYLGTIEQWCNISFGDATVNPLFYGAKLYLNGELVTELVIPNTVTEIKTYAFRNCSSLTSVVIPDSVTSIGSDAFYNCTSLTSVVIPDKVTSIGSEAFYNCTSLTSVNYLGTIEQWCNISFGDSYANPLCNRAKLYFNGELVTELVIPSTVTEIKSYAFENCTSLTSVNYLGTIEQWCNISFSNSNANPLCNGAKLYFNGELVTELVIPSTVTEIKSYAFYNCTFLTSVVIPDSVTSIGSDAFYNTSFTSVVIPDSVTSIGSYAFLNCYKLAEVYNLSKLNITKGSRDYGYVGYFALNVYTPSSGEKKTFTTDDGFIFYVDGETRYLLGYTGDETSITLPANCNGKNYAIYEHAFYDCTSLTSVVIPDNVTSIGDTAFYNCTNLTEIKFNATAMDDLSSSNYVFSNAGEDGKGIKVTIGKNVTKIPAYLFYPYSSSSYLPKITSVEFEEGSVCTSIGSSAFRGCTSVTSVVIGDSVTSIGSNAFYDCTSLTSVVIPESVTSIGSYAFAGCNSLTIYCEASSKPSGWYSNWNYSNRPVVWGHTHSYTDGQCVCGTKEN